MQHLWSKILILSFAFTLLPAITSCKYINFSGNNAILDNDVSDNDSASNNSDNNTSNNNAEDVIADVVEYPDEVKALLNNPSSVGLEFAPTQNGNGLTVIGIGTCTDTDIIIPSTHNGLPIIEIASSTFQNYSALKNIVVPDTVLEIQSGTFKGCISLKNVILGNSITKIGDKAFESCSSLQYINIPNSIEKIESIFASTLSGAIIESKNLSFNEYEGGNYLGNPSNPYLVLISINDRKLTTYKIHEDTKIIYKAVFYQCENLIAIDIPTSIKYIPNSLFANCSRLASVNLNYGLSSIDNNAFSGCSSLKSVTLPDTITKIGISAFASCSKISDITIPKSVSNIAAYTFANCYELKNVDIPSSVTAIDEYAFSNCYSITCITIPENIKSIGEAAFSNCINVNEIYFNACKMNDASSLDDIFNNAGRDSSNLKLIVGNRVERIPSYLFNGYSDSYLKYIEFENGSICESIGLRAFDSCKFLSSLKLPKSILLIETCAFINCNNLETLYYEGTDDDWTNIVIESYNTPLSKANIYYNN